MLGMSKKDLLAAIDADKESHIELLQAFIQAPSPNPPGDTTEAAEVIREYLKARDVDTTVIAPKANMHRRVPRWGCQRLDSWTVVWL